MTRLAALSLALLGSLARPALAAEQVLTFDPEATEISFWLEATAHDVHGRLYLEAGEISFDLDSGTAGGEITVDGLRTDTGNRKRDKTMHKKVLESDRFPLFVFRPTAIEGEFSDTRASELRLAGTLAIHGDEHPVSIPVQVEREGNRVSATATIIVPYVDWGMHRPKVLFLKVAPEVEVRIEAKGSLSAASSLP